MDAPSFIAGPVEETVTQFRRMRRTARVARTALTVYGGYKLAQRRSRRRKAKGEDDTPIWDAQHERAARQLYRMILDLKGLYIKTGQFAGTRADLAPPAYVKHLSKLQDRVPPRGIDVVRQTILEELGRPVEELFATFEERPIAAASLAQVHRATLPDGRCVAVKVQYPDVADLTRLDILNLQRLVRLVARLEKNFDYTAIANELATQLPLELDFEREARMTEMVRLNLAGERNIVVPRVIEGYVARKVLVTEYLDGARLLDAEQRVKHYEDPLALARAIAAIFGHQMLIDGVFQADPHPGNLLALPGNRVGIVDFGLTKELPDNYRLGFARFVMGAHQRNPLLLARGFAEMGIVLRGANQQEARMRMADLMLVAERPDNIGELDRQRRSAVRYNPIEAIPSDLILIGRVMALLRGVSASLGVVLDPMAMLAPYAERAIAADEAGVAEAAS